MIADKLVGTRHAAFLHIHTEYTPHVHLRNDLTKQYRHAAGARAMGQPAAPATR
jgi:hypothetical protein